MLCCHENGSRISFFSASEIAAESESNYPTKSTIRPAGTVVISDSSNSRAVVGSIPSLLLFTRMAVARAPIRQVQAREHGRHIYMHKCAGYD